MVKFVPIFMCFTTMNNETKSKTDAVQKQMTV
jgi:hypothetical protein